MSNNAAYYDAFNQARAEDVRWMAATGENLSGAARRLGISPDSLDKWCHKYELTAELDAFRRREPADWNVQRTVPGQRWGRWAS